MIGNRNGADPVDVDTTNSPTNSPHLAFRASQSVGMTFSRIIAIAQENAWYKASIDYSEIDSGRRVRLAT